MKDQVELHAITGSIHPYKGNKRINGIRNAFLGLIIVLILASCEQIPTTESITLQTEEQTKDATYLPTETATLEPIATLEPTPTYTLEPTATPELYTLSLLAFHDYNGNGTMEEGEPALEGIVNKTSAGNCTTGADGRCDIEGVPAGTHNISITAPSKFKYLTPNIETDTPIADGLDVTLDADIVVFEPIVEGPYRSPFHELDILYAVTWKDINFESCFSPKIGDRNCVNNLDWLGGKNTYDGHDGTDFRIGTQLPIYAMRAGIVIEANSLGNEGYSVLIKDTIPFDETGRSFQSYVHLNTLEVSVGQEVFPDTLLGVGGSSAIGGKIHINQYVGVGNQHPASADFPNPYVPCPFDQHLWTSFNSLAEIIIEIENLDGTSSGPQRQVFP